MKTIGVWNLYETLSTKNYLFNVPDAPIGDELLLPFNVLYKRGQAHDVTFVTLDLVRDMKKLDGVIFIDTPNLAHPLVRAAWEASIPRYLITFEPPVIRPQNFDLTLLGAFTKVFTWDDTLVGEIPWVVKLNYAQRFHRLDGPSFETRKLVTLIASNKTSRDGRELYSARADMIFRLESHMGAYFDLYGPGWEGHPCWRGMVASKRRALSNYRFCICYENMQHPGYITEKLFDCFIAGCVPIYLGAPNITRYVPKEAFVDARDYFTNVRAQDPRRRYARTRDMMRHVASMLETEWQRYIDAAAAWMQSDAAKPFTVEHFADTIISHVA